MKNLKNILPNAISFIQLIAPIKNNDQFASLIYFALANQYENYNNANAIAALKSLLALLQYPINPTYDNDLAPIIKFKNKNFDYMNFICNYYDL